MQHEMDCLAGTFHSRGFGCMRHTRTTPAQRTESTKPTSPRSTSTTSTNTQTHTITERETISSDNRVLLSFEIYSLAMRSLSSNLLAVKRIQASAATIEQFSLLVSVFRCVRGAYIRTLNDRPFRPTGCKVPWRWASG